MYIPKHQKIEDGQMCRLGKAGWSVIKLIHLSKDFEVMDVQLNHMCVYQKYENLTLREMVMHINAVNDADLDYPIILDEDGELMDGRHRLMKALVEGRKTIKAVRFDINPEPCKRYDD